MTKSESVLLETQIMPRLISAIPECVRFVSAEDQQEVVQDAAAMRELGLENSPWVILIDARDDNKPSASKAASH